jgi:hypothetical protein
VKRLSIKKSEALKEGLRFLYGKMEHGLFPDNNGVDEDVLD